MFDWYKILGVQNKVEEFEKANITLRVITLESSGKLTESISFPSFNYNEIVNQSWYDEQNETMADFHLTLETQKFLFVVFQKVKNFESFWKDYKSKHQYCEVRIKARDSKFLEGEGSCNFCELTTCFL